jgi:hypothetical protein
LSFGRRPGARRLTPTVNHQRLQTDHLIKAASQMQKMQQAL